MESPVLEFYKELAKPKEVIISKRGRHRISKMYFSEITEKAIIAYNLEEDR